MQNILITGGTGMIGKQLTELLLSEGYAVSHLSRGKTNLKGKIKTYHWNIEKGELEEGALTTADHIIHLAGASVAGGRWTAKRKEELYMSRIGSARLLFNKLKNAKSPVKTFISASAVGYYGDGKNRCLTEEAPAGNDFLAKLCNDWEAESFKINSLGIRTAIFRTGIVLSREGGALPEFTKSMKMGLAVYMGDGTQFLSWIHLNDICRAYLFALQNIKMEGVYNAVAPAPVTNKEMIDAIRQSKNSHALVLPAPSFALKIALGEMSTALLTGQRCSSEKLEKAGFEFRHQELKTALNEEFA